MITLIIITIILGSTSYILWPLWYFGQTITSSPGGNEGHLVDLVDQRDNLFAVLKDLESDRNMGKLSAEDFEALQNNYRAQTIQILENIDQFSMGIITDSKIRPDSPNNGGQLEYSNEKCCTSCGYVAEVEDQFCSYCGNDLS